MFVQKNNRVIKIILLFCLKGIRYGAATCLLLASIRLRLGSHQNAAFKHHFILNEAIAALLRQCNSMHHVAFQCSTQR